MDSRLYENIERIIETIDQWFIRVYEREWVDRMNSRKKFKKRILKRYYKHLQRLPIEKEYITIVLNLCITT